MKPDFRFKQFSLTDEHCAMKLTTDAVLLGSLAEPGASAAILDIGTGCGILSLLMAQKSSALIDAVEIDESAARQASQNFRRSIWNERIQVHHISIQDYAKKCSKKYDCIICNPPYFQDQLKSPVQTKSAARHNSSLGFEALSRCVCQLLSDNGSLWTIIPASEKNKFLKIFLNSGLYCKKNADISDKPGTRPHRSIVCTTRKIPEHIETQNLIMKNQDGTLSDSFIRLTCDFYPNG
ncbi:MAG TPA: methyltransferase [Bacteroidales bacterium]|nr:methyltransferase [Bacteroidales bacterium]